MGLIRVQLGKRTAYSLRTREYELGIRGDGFFQEEIIFEQAESSRVYLEQYIFFECFASEKFEVRSQKFFATKKPRHS